MRTVQELNTELDYTLAEQMGVSIDVIDDLPMDELTLLRKKLLDSKASDYFNLAAS